MRKAPIISRILVSIAAGAGLFAATVSAAPAEAYSKYTSCQPYCSNVSDSPQTLAKEILALGATSSGNGPIIQNELQPLSDTGRPSSADCAIDTRILQLLVIVERKYGGAFITDINRPCVGSSLNCAYSYHCKSPAGAIDITSVGSRSLTGVSNDLNLDYLSFVDTFVPPGTKAEQKKCRTGVPHSFANLVEFDQTECDHQHIDFSQTTAPLRISTAASAPPPPPFPDLRSDFTVAYQTSAGTLNTESSSLQISNWNYAMYPGTSPSIAYLSNGSWQIAFIGSDQTLWTVDSSARLAHLGMVVAPGTSPAITALPNGKWVIGFVGSDSLLRTIDSAYNLQNLGRSVAAKTTPSIAGLKDSSWVIAFQGSNGTISLETSALQMSDYGISLAPGSSPSVAGLSSGSFALTFVGSDNRLYVISNNQLSNFGHSIRPGTSPSVTALAGGEFVVAYVNSDCTVSSQKSSLQVSNYGICVAPNASPSIRGIAGGRWYTSFVANTGVLMVIDSGANLSNFNRPILANTSPSMN